MNYFARPSTKRCARAAVPALPDLQSTLPPCPMCRDRTRDRHGRPPPGRHRDPGVPGVWNRGNDDAAEVIMMSGHMLSKSSGRIGAWAPSFRVRVRVPIETRLHCVDEEWTDVFSVKSTEFRFGLTSWPPVFGAGVAQPCTVSKGLIGRSASFGSPPSRTGRAAVLRVSPYR